MKRMTFLGTILVALMTASALYAQPPDPLDSGTMPPRMGRGFRGGRMEPEQRRKYVEQFRLLKLLELLDLKEDQEMKFVEAFRAMRRQQRQIEQDRNDVMQGISTDIEKSQLDDARIKSATDKLFVLEDKRRELMRTFLAKVREMLTPDQVGKLIIFQERFELELLERVREFWDRTPGALPPHDNQ